ncbi:MAG TPA: hypothetical protein VIT44_04540 [Cyclobacteriaceae bacterium]
MEYTYQKSVSDLSCTALLNEYMITFRTSKGEDAIPYSMIVEVKLIRESDKKFKTLLELDNGHTYTIANYSYTPDKKTEDLSRAYTTFIRVLHFHLKDKSKAVFTSGNPQRKTWNRVTLSIIISFLISFTAEFFGVSLVNPIIQAIVLIVMMGIVILAVNMGRWPKHYHPTDIPLEFLP